MLLVITSLIGLAMLAGSYIAIQGLRNATDGYENETGFHRGTLPYSGAMLKARPARVSKKRQSEVAGTKSLGFAIG